MKNNCFNESDYVRVTQILAPYSDFSKVPPQTLEAAKIRGTLTHDACELYALDLLIEPVPEICKPYFECFKRWFDENVSEVISTEERIFHSKYFFSGKYDLLCRLKGDDRIVLVDYKTPLNTYKSWELQSAAYMLLLAEIKGVNVDRRITLQLFKDGSNAKAIEYTDHTRDQILFIHALQLYRFFNS